MGSSDTPQARRLAARVWCRRLCVEREAADRFRRLARELAQVSAADEVVALAGSAADDELRHAALCEELVVHFGGAVPATQKAVATKIGPSALSPRQRVLFEMVAMGCVTETLSTALLGALVDRARDPLAQRIMREILRDEVKHSRLGWAHLAAEHAAGQPDCVGQSLPRMLQATVREELFSTDAEHALQDELSGMGSLSRRERRETFINTMTQVVFPGLAKFGVDTTHGASWLEQKTHGTTT